MFEADPLTTATLATDAARTALQAGPPADVASQAPAFVQDILAEVGSAAGDAAGGLGETISGLTPGGGEAAGQSASEAAGQSASEAANGAATDAAGNAPEK